MSKTGRRRVYVNIDQQNPYLGLHSFRESEREYFHGRNRETRDLVELIENNLLTVVFGKSGIGKTSLLRAGLMPKLRDRYFLPLYLRIGFGDERKPPAVYQVKDAILKQVSELDPSAKPFYDSTLWEYFSSVKILGGFVKPILLFDQFEEMFTSGKKNSADVNEFIAEIANLIENRVPASVREKLGKEVKTTASPNWGSDFRVVFCLREIYLSQLEMLEKYIPSVKFSRYRVSQLQGKNAIDAVLKPGKEIIKNPEVGVKIIKKIPGTKDVDYNPYENTVESWETKKIEPFLLSLFCFQVNEKRLEAKEKEISGELVRDVSTEDIIKDYYEGNIARFSPNVKTAIEDCLITEEGFRKLEAVDSLESGYGVSDDDIERLVYKRIIRKETRMDIEYIELIHDVLAPILKESRDKRKEEERRKKELAEKEKKYSRIITAIVCVASIFIALLAVYAFQQKTMAERQRAKAEKEGRVTKAYELAAYSTNLLDKDPTLSFRLAESAYRTESTNPSAYNALLHAYYRGDFYSIFKHKNRPGVFSGHRSERSDFLALFSHDGTRILTVNSEKVVLWKWDLTVNNIPREIVTNPGDKPVAAFSPDGKTIAITGPGEKSIRLLDMDGHLVRTVSENRGADSVAFSPGSDKIIITRGGKEACLWELQSGKNRVFKGHDGNVNSAVFSPDGKYIVTAGWDKSARLWDLQGKELVKFTGHEKGVNSAEFSKDGRYIVTAGMDDTARLWDLSGNSITTFEGHTGAVTSARFSPDGRYVITASHDKTARLWDIHGPQVYEFKGFNHSVRTASFSPDGKYILIAPARGPARLRLVDAEEIIRTVNGGNVWQLDEKTKKKYNL